MQDLYPSRQANRPAFLPRKDPVVHSDWEPSSALTQAQMEIFERNGYIVLERLFHADEIQTLQEEAGQLLANPQQVDAETIITEPGSNEVRSIFRIHDQSAVLRRLATDSRLVEVARFLLGDEVYIHQSRLNYKPGFTGKEFYWHSDFETWHVEDGMPRMRALSMSVLLAENTPHNGPLMLIPGSHKAFITCVGDTPDDHYRKSLKKQEYGVPDHESLARLVNTHGIDAPTGPAGTVVIFDCNIMHGSNGNITPYPRSNAFFVYNAIGNQLVQPFGAPRPRPEFIGARSNVTAIRPTHGPLSKI